MEWKGECSYQNHRHLQPDAEKWRQLGNTYESIQKTRDSSHYCASIERTAQSLLHWNGYFDVDFTACDNENLPTGFPHQILLATCQSPFGNDCPWENNFEWVPFEVAIPLHYFIFAVEDILTIMSRADLEDKVNEKNCFFPFGVNIRFSMETEGSYLGLDAGMDVDIFKVVTVRRYDPGQARLQLASVQEIEQVLKKKYSGRSHWGQAGLAMYSNPRDVYSNWDNFLEQKGKMDPHNVFGNAYSSRVIKGTNVSEFPRCALENSCLCSHDIHCALDQTCASGVLASNAKVCKQKN